MTSWNASFDRAVSSRSDAGFFGPNSALWSVLGRRSVIMGGMRALLMQATHPLVAAATAATAQYRQDPWGRHRRTLQLMFDLVFGTGNSAVRAVRQINAAHRMVAARDPVTGGSYFATDPALLLWVHASLASSFLLYERLTVAALDDAARQRFCDEFAFMSSLLGLPRGHVPPTAEGLEAYVDETAASGMLRSTDGARVLASIIRRPSRGIARLKLQTAAFLALQTLPAPVRDLYEVSHDRGDERRLAALCATIRLGQRILPAQARLMPCALAASARTRATAGRGRP
jgi:uncharacterized protein (DUF2236 family)